MTLDKDTKTIQWGKKTVFSTNGAGKVKPARGKE